MNKENMYDVVVVGAGSGGLTSAVGFSKVGKKVLLVEREHMGGECTNTGCIPSKALLHHARNYYQAVAVSGVSDKSETYRSEAFIYVRNIINGILAEETPKTFKKIGIEVVMGEAEFISKHAIKVGETEYQFKQAVIASGSSPRNLTVPGLNETDVLTNQNIFDLKEAPEKLLVIGSGPIGLEMSQALAMLGSQVTIATIDSEFARLEDPAIQPILKASFDKLGITIIHQAFLNRVEGKEAIFDIKDGDAVVSEERVLFDKMLVAIGRTPNLPSGLEVAGIESSPQGITINSQNRTTNKRVFAVGDVAERLKFTHVADDIGRQVVTHVVSKGLFRVNKNKAVPKVTYTSPEVAQVGLSWTDAVAKLGQEQVIRIEVPFANNDRAKTDDETSGLLVVVAKRLSGKVLGANMAGPAAGELISIFTLAIDQKISLWKLQKTIFAYPTYSLIIKKASDYFFAKQIANLKTDVLFTIKKSLPKIILASVWIAALWYLYSWQQMNGVTPTETAFGIFDFIALTAWGPIIYVVAYAVRPLTFFPGTVLTILSGVVFGFYTGILLTIIAANISAAIAYGVGRFFGKDLKLEDGFIGNWVTALRENTFTAMLTMRLIFLPFDGVSYFAGILKTKFVPYLTATFLGTLLGIATFVAIGASLDVESFRQNGITADVIDIRFIITSVTIFVASLVTSRLMKRRKAGAKI
jgi:pyruvate/2-oxoglutarate dehydrogenase complex dihydrolipoamide dehydrogenase (E3) component/uncharacterized membrane protein YdjX (TVP38/TMEM64 family)